MASWQRLLVVRSRVGLSRAAVVAALLAATVVLGGCAPAAAPKPTPTPLFTSEADAFKAAEQVYRDYVDAGNGFRNGDASADPMRYLAGSALESEIDSSRKANEQGLKLSGTIQLLSFSGTRFEPSTSEVTAKACVDVANTRVSNEAGVDVTPKGRASDIPLTLRFDRSADDSLVITKSASGEFQCDRG